LHGGQTVSRSDVPRVGSIVWSDLTVPDAARIRDFYAAVVGWEPEAVDMGAYSDFTMKTSDGTGVAGVCHARGVNADLPGQWLIYIIVKDLGQSIAQCEELGGEVLVSPRDMGGTGRYCVIRDPTGAVAALFQTLG
jgi:predicted enzyme related to lactoylglutathione lyase